MSSDSELWWTGETAVKMEQSVLGSVLIAGNSVLLKVEAAVGPQDFMVDSHRLIFEAIQSVAHSGADPDLILVTYELAKQGRLERAGGPAFISMLVDRIPCVESAGEYAKRVHECSIMRRIKGITKGGTGSEWMRSRS